MALADLVQGPRPDITPPQVVAMGTAGIPILASLLSAFGLYDLSPEQQEALSDAVTWGAVAAASLIGGDAALRTARNKRMGEVERILAEGGEDLEITRAVMKHDEMALGTIPTPSSAADPTTYMRPGSEDETQIVETGFEEKPPPPLPRRQPRRHRRK